MNHTKTQKLLRPIKDFGGRIFTTVLLFRRKKKLFNAFSWAKNTTRGVRFLRGFNTYLILALCEQVYLFLALDPNKIRHVCIYSSNIFGGGVAVCTRQD